MHLYIPILNLWNQQNDFVLLFGYVQPIPPTQIPDMKKENGCTNTIISTYNQIDTMHLQFDLFFYFQKNGRKQNSKTFGRSICVCLLFPYYHNINRNLRFMQIEKLLIVSSQGFVNKLMCAVLMYDVIQSLSLLAVVSHE